MLKVDNIFHTWEELVEKYPNKWVVVENAELDESRSIISGELIGVCSDNEVDDFLIKCYSEGRKVKHERTILGSGVGVINVEGVTYIVE